MGWKQIHFSLHLEDISVATQRNKNGPLGTQSYSEPCAFPPDPVLLVVGPWVTQSLSCSYFLCNTNSTAVPKSDRWTKRMFSHLERQRICCLTLVDSDSLLVIWCTFIYLFLFLLIFPFLVSVDSASSSTRHESISVLCRSRGTPVGNGTQLAIVHALSHLMTGPYS